MVEGTVRPSFGQLLMETAELWSQRGTCSRLRVGAVLARENRILTQGFNGAPAGMEHCGDPHPEGPCQVSAHAEENVLFFAAKYGIPTRGADLWVTHAPCSVCSRGIVNSGISRVSFKHRYRDMSGVALLQKAGVEVIDFVSLNHFQVT